MIDFRKNIQHINIKGYEVYIWLYRRKNFLSYGINGTSLHFVINDYKSKSKCEIMSIIMENIYDNIKE